MYIKHLKHTYYAVNHSHAFNILIYNVNGIKTTDLKETFQVTR